MRWGRDQQAPQFPPPNPHILPLHPCKISPHPCRRPGAHCRPLDPASLSLCSVCRKTAEKNQLARHRLPGEAHAYFPGAARCGSFFPRKKIALAEYRDLIARRPATTRLFASPQAPAAKSRGPPATAHRNPTCRLRYFGPGFRHVRLKGYASYPPRTSTKARAKICGRLSGGTLHLA